MEIDRMKLAVRIVPEDDNGGFVISWRDTLCSKYLSHKDYLQKRPLELYTHITNVNNDTFGYYRGLSSPQ